MKVPRGPVAVTFLMAQAILPTQLAMGSLSDVIVFEALVLFLGIFVGLFIAVSRGLGFPIGLDQTQTEQSLPLQSTAHAEPITETGP